MNQEWRNENSKSTDDPRDGGEGIMQPVPAWIKQGGTALVIIVVLFLIWVFATGNDSEPPVILSNIESAQPAFGSDHSIEAKPDEAPVIPVHSATQFESKLYTSDDSSLPLVEINNPTQTQLAKLQDDLTTLIQENSQRQDSQDTLINELNSLVTAQALKFEQLQSNLKTGKVSVKPRKKVVRTYRPITLPFTLVSVDQWGNDLYAVIRSKGQLYELTNGQSSNGWQVLLIDRSKGTVTFKNTAGKQKELFITS